MFVLGWIFFGALTGWLASKIVNRRGEGCILNTALGLIGAVVGGFLFRQFGPFDYDTENGLVSLFVAVLGAVIVLVIWNAATGKRPLR